jgi:hypothetical protein
LKPGIKFENQSRWIQVTSNVIRYYKNRWTSNSTLVKPLNAVPLNAIDRLEVYEPETFVNHAKASKS